MKRPFLLGLSFSIAFSVLLTSCGSGETDKGGSEEGTDPNTTETVEPIGGELEDLVPLDLKDKGLPFALLVPDTSVGYPEVINQSWGSTEIKVGKKFQLEIAIGGDLGMLKADLKADDVYTSEIIEETPTSILYRSKIADSGIKPEHHFYAVVTINGTQYEVKDMKNGGPYGERSARQMMEAANHMGQ